MESLTAEKRLERLFETEGFATLKNRLDQILSGPVWWYCSEPSGSIRIVDDHGKLDCGLVQAEGELHQEWLSATRESIAKVATQQEGSVQLSPPGRIQVIVPILCGNDTIGFLGLAHLPLHEGQRLTPLVPLLGDYLRQIAERERAGEDLKGVKRLWRDVVSSLDPDLLEDRILEEILSLLDSPTGVLLITDSHRNLVPKKWSGTPAGLKLDHGFQIVATPYENKIASWPRPVHLLSDEDPLRRWFVSKLEIDSDTRGVWAVPLKAGANLVGMAVCLGPVKDALTPNSDAALETLAFGASVAIRNAQEFDRMRQKAVALSTVHSVYRLMSTTREVSDLLIRMANLTIQVLNVRRCSIMLVDSLGNLNPHVQIGLQPGEIGTRPLKVGEGIPGHAAETAMSLLIERPHTDARFEKDPKEFYPSESYLSVPLFEEDVVGVITVSDRIGDPPRFLEGDREVLNTLAEQAVIALLNIQFFEKQEKIALKTMETFVNLFEMGDPQKAGHAHKFSNLIDGFAQFLKIDSQPRQLYRMAAFIHDVARNKTAAKIDKVQSEEAFNTKQTELAIRIARSLDLPENLIPSLRDRHERFDGTGMPRGLRGEQIPLGARILNLVDSYLNLVYPGEGIHGYTATQAIHRLGIDSGSRYDPNLLESLCDFLKIPRTEIAGEEKSGTLGSQDLTEKQGPDGPTA
jgi:HD-GYP domain-containing protein (c-di-GMP phosphodiesterase class II)